LAIRCIEGAHIGPVVNKAQYEKIQGLIQSAIDEGATLETGGTDRPADLNRGYYIKPTCFRALRRTCASPRKRCSARLRRSWPMMISIKQSKLPMTPNMACRRWFRAIRPRQPKSHQTACGMVAINNWGPAPGAPFGGYKQSGNGREAGLFGLKDFMEVKAISGLPA
jgi:aldehyde dehydrogenase (NAD+)